MAGQKALLLKEIGKPLELVEDRPIPEPTTGQVQVKVKVASLIPSDQFSRDWGLLVADKLPAVLSKDVMGIVSKTGQGVTSVQVGDRVIHRAEVAAGFVEGGLQEYAITDARLLGKIPSGISDDEAATIPTNLTSVATALFINLGISPPWSPDRKTEIPQAILIVGGGSACGQFATELSKLAGISKIVVVGGDEANLKARGATHFIDRHAEDAGMISRIREIVGDDLLSAFDTVNPGQGIQVALSALSRKETGKVARLVPAGPLEGVEIYGHQVIDVLGNDFVRHPVIEALWQHTDAKQQRTFRWLDMVEDYDPDPRQFIGKHKLSLPSPSLCISLPIVKNNAAQLHDNISKAGVTMRAHLKTNKTTEVTRIMLGNVSKKVAISTLPEAQGLKSLIADGTVNDVPKADDVFQIMWAIPISPSVLPALDQLSRNVTLHLMVDHIDQIDILARYTRLLSTSEPWSLFVKLDLGSKRAGVRPDSSQLPALMEAIESRTTIYNDLQQLATGTITRKDLAMTVIAEVCSVYEDRKEVLINAGVLALTREPGDIPGLACVRGTEHEGWIVDRVSQEHGILVYAGSKESLVEGACKIGDKLELDVQHTCIVGAMYRWHFITDEDGIVRDVYIPWKWW
ncbi:hypothetical protein PRZ48_010273 [Zasmidium cellare]|uniref:Enoyl reductase (ER) domain-containing protein n=1 Tax=Zasmidium cellare TaxID=395010 RepID=A0ABR0E8R2_ZASCE|nr:hypothetical protein PRZ48_010273 [Zasmidium cellare]